MYNGILFTGDMHLRADAPVCRTDDFLVAQWGKLEQIQKCAERNNLAWIDAGDIFHKAVPSLHFVNQVLTRLHYRICAGIMGNHDLPSHNTGRVMESAWGTLHESAWLEARLQADQTHIPIKTSKKVAVYGASYGEEILEPCGDDSEYSILVLHDMVYASKFDTIPNAPGNLAKKLLRDNKGYDLIVTGHNHQSFMVELNGRHLVNVGSMTRQTANQADHKPRIMIWRPDTTNGGLQWITLSHQDGVVSREHLDKQEQKEEELNAFVASLQNVDEVSLSFEDNVETVIRETKPDKPVEQKVREAME